MKTGEARRSSPRSGLLNALEGKGVHVVTVNDYLAAPGLRVDGPHLPVPRDVGGVVQHDLSDAERRVAYACDIT